MSPKDLRMIHQNGIFSIPDLKLETYKDDYFKLELDLESDVFYDLRVSNGWLPHRINESSEKDLKVIKDFFNQNSNSFYFLFDNNDLIGSTMHRRNYIQCLCISKKYQHKGYGSLLTKFVVNTILGKGFPCVELNVLPDNYNAINMYKKLGFTFI
ncbi:MAG: GNAT family N-acetyltransferase [Candidatus Latescibacteria bacterium]|nr:GNAT family N-acetyltransferase [Candidatus Latescibacterota bacterium]